MIAKGELKERIKKNIARLSAKEYTAPCLFAEGGSWPGDWQGRTILALASLVSVAEEGEEKNAVKNQLDAIISLLPSYTNGHGYFGEILNRDYVNEQQVSGNSWFLRGLCSYFELTGDPSVFTRIRSIEQNYLLALEGLYRRYPLSARGAGGGVSGHVQLACNGWQLSTDVGCAFIMLDGISHVYLITENSRLLDVADEMTEILATLDVVALKCQTHAVLSASRGLLRLHATTGNARYFQCAKRLVDCYLACGMTLNYANFNWFGCAPTWTEPCAVLDSVGVFQRLYSLTGEDFYLELVNRIYKNAVRPAQRPNGGAGCETCLCKENPVLKMHLYEAFFCCSMRMGEGLKFLCDGLVLEEKKSYIVAMPLSFHYRGECAEFSCNVVEDLKGAEYTIEVTRGENFSLSVYLPLSATVACERAFRREGRRIFFDGVSAGDKINFCFAYLETVEERQGIFAHMKGDYLLLKRAPEAPYESAVFNSIEEDSESVAKACLYL